VGIGHLAVAFAAKRAVPRAPLALLLFAATLPDVLWGTLVLSGVERARIVPGITAASALDLYHYPYSHSLAACVLWAALAAAAVFLFARDRALALLVAACVLSHWVLDVISHRRDVPVGLHGPYLGLGLWNSVSASIAVEESMLAIGLMLYVRATVAKSPAATWGLAALALLFAGLGVAGYLAPPPPAIAPVAASNLAGVLFVLAAHAIDRRRAPALPAPAAHP